MLPTDRDHKTAGEKWFTAVFAMVFAGLMLGMIFQDYRPEKLAVLFVPLAWLPLLVIHELGHAAAARMCGWGLRRIVIGTGRERFRIRCLGTWMSIRTWPVSGYVLPRLHDVRGAKWKSAFIYAAGPGSELLVAALVRIFAGDAIYESPRGHIGLIAAQSIALAALADAALNLFPMPVQSDGQYVANDGLGIINSLRMSKSDYARRKQQEDWQDLAEAREARSKESRDDGD
jgi:hypothetical protein